MAWRVARSLDVLLNQLNALAPRRNKASDGSIGDVAHQNRSSDHNPWYPPPNGGIVTARDFTHDPGGGLDCHWLANTLVAHRDPRIKYIIWNRQIWSPGDGWKGYSGPNPHTSHLHLSVVASGANDSTSLWPGIPAPRDEVELTDKLGFWHGGQITVGEALANTWQLVSNITATETFEGRPGDIPEWVTTVRREVEALRADVASLKARSTKDIDEAALAAELAARGVEGVSAAELLEVLARARGTRSEAR